MSDLRTRVLVVALLIASLAIAVACDGPGPVDEMDAGPPPIDAGPPVPLTLSLESGLSQLEFGSDPGRLTLSYAGATLLQSAATFLEVGTAPGGDQRYHSPIEREPAGVTFSTLDTGVERIDDTHARVRDARGRVATITLSEVRDGVIRMRVEMDPAESSVAMMRARFVADSGSFQGLGERFGVADARGSVVPMQFTVADAQARTSGTNEHHVPVPFVVNSNGWGLFVESREAGAFDVAASDTAEMAVTYEGRVLDLVFFAESTPARTIAAYTQHTGLPRLAPRWAYAPMHWRNEWDSRAVLEEDMARIRAEGVPTTSFWIDNPWQVSYNDSTFDESRFPDAAGMLTAMREQGYMPLVWSTPYLDTVAEGASPDNPAETLFVEARDAGYLVQVRGSVYASPAAPGAVGALIDFTSRDARAFWQRQLDPLIAMGVRSFKLDYGEDIVPALAGARPRFEFSDGTSERETHGVYNILYHQPYRDALDAGSGGDGGFLLVRGSTWGGQTVADIIWPGDLDNDLREAGTTEVGGLPAAITALISLAASGFPAFGSDTGGYRGGMPEREHLLRWAEHTALSPIMQLGGAGEHHNPWLYDAEAGEIYRRLARLHMDLVPYFRVLAIRASADGTPPILHPSLAYPADRAGYSDPYAYLIGRDLFVASVVVPGATTRALHLPPGRWIHWFTGMAYEGETDITVDAPLGEPPLFVRQGALLPMLPGDLDTLVETAAPVVSPSARPFMRARSIPSGGTSVRFEEGIDLSVERDAEGMKVMVSIDGSGVSDLRLEIDLAHAQPVVTTITAFEVGGAPVSAATDADAVRAGCDGVCWFRDGDTLLISIRAAGATAIDIR